jgi:hypothetical protein
MAWHGRRQGKQKYGVSDAGSFDDFFAQAGAYLRTKMPNVTPRPAPPWLALARSVCAHAVLGAVAVASVAMCAVRYYWEYRDSVGDAGMADGKHAAHGCTARGTVENVRV